MQSDRTRDVATATASLNGWNIRHSPSWTDSFSDYLKGDAWIRVHWDSRGRVLRASLNVPGFSNSLHRRSKGKRRMILEALEKFPG